MARRNSETVFMPERERVRPAIVADILGALLVLSSSRGAPESLSPTAPQDGVVLTLTPGPGPGEVTLTWSGGLAPYSVYRSTDKTGVVDDGNLLGTTNGQSWIDAPPAGPATYY
jgi:hypothetical protein